jgi:hypothetical protein
MLWVGMGSGCHVRSSSVWRWPRPIARAGSLSASGATPGSTAGTPIWPSSSSGPTCGPPSGRGWLSIRPSSPTALAPPGKSLHHSRAPPPRRAGPSIYLPAAGGGGGACWGLLRPDSSVATSSPSASTAICKTSPPVALLPSAGGAFPGNAGLRHREGDLRAGTRCPCYEEGARWPTEEPAPAAPLSGTLQTMSPRPAANCYWK